MRSPSLLILPGSPSASSTSPQFGSPDSDRYSQDLYHPPSPATSPDRMLLWLYGGPPQFTPTSVQDVLEDEFFHKHYCGLMRKLYNQRFIDSIQHLLNARNICEDDGRVRTVAKAYLYELTLMKQIYTPIHDMYEQLIGEDVKKLQQLQTMTKSWEG